MPFGNRIDDGTYEVSAVDEIAFLRLEARGEITKSRGTLRAVVGCARSRAS